MTTLRVKTDGLSLRRSPRIEPGNIIDSLPLAHEVEVLDGPTDQGFTEVKTILNGTSVTGFAHSKFLRPPVSPLKEALLQELVREWLRFNRGAGTETFDPFFRFIGELCFLKTTSAFEFLDLRPSVVSVLPPCATLY